jgi:acid phosphatase type 7
MKSTRMLALSLLGACTLNQSGNIGASKVGDLSNPAERRSPIEELRAACGTGDPTDYGKRTLKREPYLQQVTDLGAMVGWVTTEPVGAHVNVATPGEPARSALAREESVILRTSGEKQMWTEVDALSPDTIYCYTLADEKQALTQPTGLRTAPPADGPQPVRFLAFGDSGGGGSDQYALLQQMYTVPYDLMIHTGDVAYDNGTIQQYEDNVFGVYADLFRNIPFFPSSGNHDYRTLSGAPFRDVFNLPGDNGEKWYSYDWGRVHFVALDTEADYRTQAAWLDEDLARSTAPWKIVYMHRPPYSSGSHGSDTALRKALEPVLARHQVQLVLAGHDHNYERILPQKGTHYVVTGGGGIGTRAVGSSSFTALSVAVIHFVYGEVFEDELVLHAIDGMGREFDSVRIPRT